MKQLGKASEREMRYGGEERDRKEHESKGGDEASDSEGWRLITHCGESLRGAGREFMTSDVKNVI